MNTFIPVSTIGDYLDKDIGYFFITNVHCINTSIRLELQPENTLEARPVCITCQGVIDFQIRTSLVAFLELVQDHDRIAPYTDATITYVLTGDDVPWKLLLGELTQQFGDVPYLLEPRYVRETQTFPNYRLPITVPTSADTRFKQIMRNYNVPYYVHQTSPAKAATELLFFGAYPQPSFILAEQYTAEEIATLA